MTSVEYLVNHNESLVLKDRRHAAYGLDSLIYGIKFSGGAPDQLEENPRRT